MLLRLQLSDICRHVYLCSLQTFYEAAEIGAEEPAPEASQLLVAVTSDRGLCGTVHSSIAKRIRANYTPEGNYKIVCIGDKSRSILQRYVRSHSYHSARIGTVIGTVCPGGTVELLLLQRDEQRSVICRLRRGGSSHYLLLLVPLLAYPT